MNIEKKTICAEVHPIKNSKDFWNWFNKNSDLFFFFVKNNLNVEQNFLDLLLPNIKVINSDFWFECGMYDTNTAELIITAETNLKAIAFVEDFIASAPKINNWKFTALKKENSMDELAITIDDKIFKKNKLFFSPKINTNKPDEINISLTHIDANLSNIDEYVQGCFIYLDYNLGELNSVTKLDAVEVEAKEQINGELIPISKLKSYLNWRQKEFFEKYEGLRYNTENDQYISYEGEYSNGMPSLSVMNFDLLNWEAKASHCWMSIIDIEYKGDQESGLPFSKDYELFNEFEEELNAHLVDFDGHLNVGNTTGYHIRRIYIASKDFRKPSKVIAQLMEKYKNHFKIDFDLFKDKYWNSLAHFNSDMLLSA